jgi:hypothetical protein
MTDLQKAKTPLVVLSIGAVLLAVLVLLLLRRFAPVLIWLVYWGLLVVSVALMAWLWYLYTESSTAYGNAVAGGDAGVTAAKRNRGIYFALAVGWQLVGTLLVVVLLVMHNRIKLVVALFEESSRCIGSMPFILLLPLMSLVLGTIAVVYFLCIGLFLISAGDMTVDPKTNHATFVMSQTLQAWTFYHVFGFFWTLQFVLAFQETVPLFLLSSFSHFGYPRRKISGDSRLEKCSFATDVANALTHASIRL